MSDSEAAKLIGRQKPRVEHFNFGPWKLTASKSHILVSEGPDRENFEAALKLPNVPEMIYDKNTLRVDYGADFAIEFNALDALKLVDAENPPFKVDGAEEWLEARADSEFTQKVVKPHDWTFTTEYNGTIIDPDNKLTISETTERINIEKLKTQERIFFFQDIMLFEDELSDNGDSNISVKVRVMASSFFILLRQYMRVDRVVVRINDTRLYHEGGWNYIIRETSTRLADLKKCRIPQHIIQDKNEVWQHIPLVKEKIEKLEFKEEISQ